MFNLLYLFVQTHLNRVDSRATNRLRRAHNDLETVVPAAATRQPTIHKRLQPPLPRLNPSPSQIVNIILLWIVPQQLQRMHCRHHPPAGNCPHYAADRKA